jgi:nitrite reductase/ring-hydroxylating ferredoxin subunit
MAYMRACATSDLPTGEMKRVRIGDKNVLVYHLADGFYATQASCPHTFGPLHRGKIVDGSRVRCPLHRAEFDIHTGEAKCWAVFPPGVQLFNFLRKRKPLTTYPVKVENGEVLVDT